MTELPTISGILEQSLKTVFLPIVLKILGSVLIPIIIGMILIIIMRRSLPKKLGLLAEVVIKIAVVIIVGISATNTIKNIKLPEPPPIQEQEVQSSMVESHEK